eukprot:14564812-Alexandrium_andersonii.AAC.1
MLPRRGMRNPGGSSLSGGSSARSSARGQPGAANAGPRPLTLRPCLATGRAPGRRPYDGARA